MKIRGIVDEDFVNYKLPSMVIEMPYCDFKCDKECGRQICQNNSLIHEPIIDINDDLLIQRYLDNIISEALVFQGLEPLDSIEELMPFIEKFRAKSNDDIVIYTGYKEDEMLTVTLLLSSFKNIIIKYGRFRPNEEKHFDKTLGIYLASNNQYAKKIS